MKALTLTQPWATLVAIGAKKIETRGWKTDYRGPLAIHAAKGYPKEARRLAYHIEPFRTVLAQAHCIPTQAHGMTPENLPLGMVIATCTLINCRLITPESMEFGANGIMWTLDDQERAFGDYTPGRYAWLLADVQPLATPVPARGSLGLWDWVAA